MMEPVKNAKNTVDDLLEVILNKGIVLQTDMIISVANIPLIGISLKAAIAGMETMLKYGMMKGLDAKTRQWALNHIRDRKLNLLNSQEEIVEEMYGSYWQKEDIYNAWRPGSLYLTEKRLILYQKLPSDIIFSIDFKCIKEAKIIEMEQNKPTSETDKRVISFFLKSGEEEILYVHTPEDLLAFIQEKI